MSLFIWFEFLPTNVFLELSCSITCCISPDLFLVKTDISSILNGSISFINISDQRCSSVLLSDNMKEL